MSMNDKKMSGKQEQARGFDLAAFVGGAEPEPVIPPEPQKQAPKAIATQKRVKPPVASQKPVREANKPPKEALTERFNMRLSKSEMKRLNEKRGLVPAASFLREFLKEKGFFE